MKIYCSKDSGKTFPLAIISGIHMINFIWYTDSYFIYLDKNKGLLNFCTEITDLETCGIIERLVKQLFDEFHDKTITLSDGSSIRFSELSSGLYITNYIARDRYKTSNEAGKKYIRCCQLLKNVLKSYEI